MIALKSVGVAIPLGFLSANDVGERIVFIALVIGGLTVIWRALKAITGRAKREADLYTLAEKYLPIVAAHLPSILEELTRMREDVDELKRAGELVDIVRDDHVREARDALRRVGLPHDAPAD